MMNFFRNVLAMALIATLAGALNSFWGWFLVPLGATSAMNYKIWFGLILLASIFVSLRLIGRRSKNQPDNDEGMVGKQVDAIATVAFIWGVGLLVQTFL